MLTLVVTVYNENLGETKTLNSLQTIFSELALPDNSQMIIYDNSHKSQEHQLLDLSYNQLAVIYKHNSSNPGIAAAYNFALEQAIQLEHQWLMLLDQDTEVSLDYFKEVLAILEIGHQESVALVPKIIDGNKQISPVFVSNHNEVVTGTYQSNQEIMAINSGATLSVTFLRDIAGFNLEFPLDYLDHWLFWIIRNQQRSVTVLSSKLNHNLSVSHLKEVSNDRYYSILSAEKRYNRKFAGQKKLSYYGRMLYRMMKCLIISPSKIKVIAKVLVQRE